MSEENGDIRREDGGCKGRYMLDAPGGAAAELTYGVVGADRITIDHTEVPRALRGRGAGMRPVARAAEDARAVGRDIIPLCPFAAARFRRHPEWADVRER